MGKNKNKKNYQAKQGQSNAPSQSHSFTVLNNQMSNQQTVISGQSNILKQITSSDSEISISDFEDNLYKQKITFSIKQWFHLGLSKIIPPSDKSIIIDLINNEVSGQKSKVEAFCQKAQKQIDSMVIKIVKLKLQISPDTITYEMDQNWKCQIFTVQLLRKVWEKILKTYKVNEEMKGEIQNILNKDGVNNATRFLWVLKNVQEQAVDIIKRIHKEKKQKLSESMSGEVTVCAPKIEERPYRIQQKSSKIEQKLSQSKFISGIKRQQKFEEEKPQKKPFDDDDSDEFDFTQLMVNANSKHPKKQTDIKNQKAKRNQQQAQSFLKLLDDERQMSMIKPKQASYDSEQQDQTTKVQRGNRRAPKRKTIFVSDYPEQYIDQNHLKKWVKGNRHLNVRDLEINEKFSQQDNQMHIEVIIYGDQSTKEKYYSINLYFKHEKVIKLDPEDQELRKKIIEKFVSNDSWLKIQHKKIYTRQKYPNYNTLKDFCRADNSAKNMNTTQKNLTHVLFIVGLITQVSEIQAEVYAYIKELQNTCRKVEIKLKFISISEFMREKRLQSFIDDCIKQFMSKQTEKHKLLNIKHVYSEFVVQMELFGVPQKELKNAQQNIAEKLQGLIDSFEMKEQQSKIILAMFDKLSSKFMLFKNVRNTVTLIAKSKQIKDQMVSINKEVKQSLKNIMKEHIIKQKSEFALSKDFVQKKCKQKQITNLKIRFQEGNQLKIVFFGPEMLVNDLVAKLQEFLENLEGKIWQYNISLSDEELDIIQKDKEVHKNIEDKWKITLKCNRNYSIGAIINIKPKDSGNSEKKVYFQKQFNFESLQENNIFFFRDRKQLESVKLSFILPFKALVNNKRNNPDAISEIDKQRKCHFIFKQEATGQQIIEESKKCNPNVTEIYMYLSENIYNYDIYLKNLIKIISEDKQMANKQLKITIICKKNQDLKNILNLKEGKHVSTITRKWYTTQGQNKLFYSESGNKKIQDTLKNGTNVVQLNNEDLNLTVSTHQFDFDAKVMTHIQSGNQFPIQIHPNMITVNLNGVQKTIPDSQYQKIPKSGSFWSSKKLTNCKLSIGFYQINLNAKTQTNLFSNFKRNLAYEQNESKELQNYDLVVNYQVKTNKLTLEYSDQHQKSLKPTVDHIKHYFDRKLIEIVKPFDKQFTLQLIGQFQQEGKQQNIRVLQSQDGKSAVFRAYNQKNIENFVKMLTHLGKAKVNKTINVQYPKEWQVQTQDIQTFVVNINTVQFAKVQNAFTAGTIVELIRIQNKSVYKKYTEEMAFLRELNEGNDIKEMLLFHGTRSTDPKVIYEDKEDCFNINFTSQGNLLGRGTYFAERSQYSVHYSFNDKIVPGVSSMFYCQVLVGDSQKCPKHNGNIRDTDFKDPVKRIKFESMTDFLQGSNVFVVYKNRRAYPLYLIKYKSKRIFGF